WASWRGTGRNERRLRLSEISLSRKRRDGFWSRVMDMEKLVALCRRKGFVFQSSEIYGGISGFWDYGPLGVELKRNIKDAWWNDMVRNPPPGPEGQEIAMVGVDCSIIMNPEVWVASGHVGGFADWMVDCKNCRKRFRADKVFFAGLFVPETLDPDVV